MNKTFLTAAILISVAFAQQNQEQQEQPQELLPQEPQQEQLQEPLPQESQQEQPQEPPPQEPQQEQLQESPPQEPKQELQQTQPPQQQIPSPEQQQIQVALPDSVKKDSVSVNKDTGRGFYFRLIGGYAFGAGATSGESNLGLPAKSTVSSSERELQSRFGTVQLDSSTNKTVEKNEPFSLGGGLKFGIGIGYMFNKNIGFELHGSYLSSSYEIEDKNSTYYHSHVSTSANNRATVTLTTSSSSNSETHTINRTYITIAPALRLVASVSDALSLYSLMEVSIPISDNAVYEYEKSGYSRYSYSITGSSATNNNSSDQEYKKLEFTPFFELGYSASLGLNYAFGKVLSLFVEANINTASFEVQKEKIIEWTQSSNSNGNRTDVDLLRNMKDSDKETDYVREKTTSNNTKSNNDKISFSLPASSIGVNSGLMFKF
jgi:hypothetical protein